MPPKSECLAKPMKKKTSKRQKKTPLSKNVGVFFVTVNMKSINYQKMLGKHIPVSPGYPCHGNGVFFYPIPKTIEDANGFADQVDEWVKDLKKCAEEKMGSSVNILSQNVSRIN